MTTQQAIDHYGSDKELAHALGIYPQAIHHWGEYPPPGRQYELEVKTKGKLKAERAVA